MTDTITDAMLNAYIGVALWSSMDWVDDSGGEPLDANYDADDLAPEAVESMRADLTGFVEQLAEEGIDWRAYMDEEQLAHDLWLTQNHHGAGFWDRGYPDGIGDVLTKWAHTFGTVDLYIGDDGLIYAS